MEPTTTLTSSKPGDYGDKHTKNMTRKQLEKWIARELAREKLGKKLGKKYNTKVNSLDGAIDIILPINEELTKKLLDLCDSYTNNIIEIKELFEKAFKNGERIDVDYQDEYGDTALMHASRYGYLEIVEYLLENKANLNLQNEQGETALMLASEYGDYIEVVKFLIKNGADEFIGDIDGKQAYVKAYMCGHYYVKEYLSKFYWERA